jgi:hypothetical protein
MPVTRLSVSVSLELAAALRLLARRKDMDVSRLVETLLRETPIVAASIRAGREAEWPLAKKGRDVEKLRALAKAARGAWDERVRKGAVRLP